MKTGCVTSGSWLSGWIVCTPAPGMAKAIVSAAGFDVSLLTSRIAWRSEPAPPSAAEVTHIVESRVRSSIRSRYQEPRARRFREKLWRLRRGFRHRGPTDVGWEVIEFSIGQRLLRGRDQASKKNRFVPARRGHPSGMS